MISTVGQSSYLRGFFTCVIMVRWPHQKYNIAVALRFEPHDHWMIDVVKQRLNEPDPVEHWSRPALISTGNRLVAVG